MAALDHRSWWLQQRWLILRRSSQIAIMVLFMIGPLAGIWLIQGSLSSSLLLDTVPMSDPLLVLQVLLTGHLPEMMAIIGAVLITLFYFLVGGRVFCGWVCPVNIVTDASAWLRQRLGITTLWRMDRNHRYWMLAMVLLLALLSGDLVWEQINPVTHISRGLFFGLGWGWLMVMVLFLFDLMLLRDGWCGHLCPMGAMYSLLGRYSPLRMVATERTACDDCGDCYRVCPEPQILKPVLKDAALGVSPVISNGVCSNCGRCQDVCRQQVFQFELAYRASFLSNNQQKREVTP